MKTKLIVWIVGILAVLGVSNAQTLTLSTQGDDPVGYGCLVPVDIYVDAEGQPIDSLSLAINSKLTFFDFVPSTGFIGHFLKPASAGEKLLIKGFASIGAINTGEGKIGTIYYINQLGDTSAEVSFLFNGEGNKGDSDLYNRGVDVLKNVNSTLVYLDENISCNDEIDVIFTGGMINMNNDELVSQIIDDLVEEYDSLHGSFSFIDFLVNNRLIFLIILIVIILLIIIIKSRKSKVLLIILPICLLTSFTSSAYLYFNGNSDNGFQQGCSESLNLKMDAENLDISTIQGELDLDVNTNPIEGTAGGIVSYFNYQCPNCIYTDNVSHQISGLQLRLKSNKKDGGSCTTNSCWVGVFSFKPKIMEQIDYQFVMHINSINLTKDKPENDLAKQALNAYYTGTVSKQPCFPDGQNPSINSLVISGTNISLSGNKRVEYDNINGFSLLLSEPTGSKGTGNVPARYAEGYLQGWTGNNDASITNQYGVNSGSFELHIDGNGVHRNFKCSDAGVNCIPSGTTWEGRSLNYNVTIDKSLLFDFGVEQKITITGSVADNTGSYKISPNRNSSLKITFNEPELPTIGFVYPNNTKKGSVNITLQPDIKLTFSDDWAGVDTGRVQISFNSGSENICIMSGTDFDTSWFTLTSGGPGKGNSGSYDLNFRLPDNCKLPEATEITMDVIAYDLANTKGTNSLQFTTRPACDALACCVPMEIDMITGNIVDGFDFYRLGTMTALTISGAAEFSAEWTGSDEEGWIGTGTLTCQTQGLSIYAGDSETNEFRYFTDSDSLVISGNDVEAEFNPVTNTLLLKRKEYPEPNPVITSPDQMVEGSVKFTWDLENTGYADKHGGGLSGFYWELSGDDSISGYTPIDTMYVDMPDLPVGRYSFKVQVVYNDGTGQSDTKENISVAKKPAPATGGGSFGGGSTQMPKDDCPDGDTSDSYYDGICEGATHGSAVYQCKIDESNYGDERKLAYLYSYINHITTMCPIYEADLDGYLYRDHFAKMISNYAINVLGKKPNLNKTGCDQFEDIADDSAEMKYYMKLACQLNLMGMEPDGQTPKKLFDPYSAVTRAEFGTVFSRLLFGDTYNVKGELKTADGWYRGHLQALKDYGVMTKIEDPRPSYLELRGRVMIVLMRADHYGLFEGVSPALNGIDALFAKKWEANVF